MKKTILILVLAMLMLTGCFGSKTNQESATAHAQAPSEPASAQTVPIGNLITVPTTAPAPATEPVTAPTTAPTVPAAIVITKHPSSETVSVGARTWFIAKAENETQITWEFFSPDGTMFSLQQTMLPIRD